MADWPPPAGHAGRWILACAGGLALGMALGTAWNALVLPQALPGLTGPMAAPPAALGGAIMGACLGLAQAWALRPAYRALPVAGWVGMSAAAGFLAALVVTLVFALLTAQAGGLPAMGVVLGGAVVKGVASGLAFGALQGRVLDRVVAERATWARVVMVGWLLGALLASMRWVLLPPTGGPIGLVSGAVLGGAVEGLALGLVTAGALRFMPPR